VFFKATCNQRAAVLSMIAAMILWLTGSAAAAAPADGGGAGPAQPEVRIESMPEIVKMIPAGAAAAVMAPDLGAIQADVGALMKAIGVEAEEAKTPVTTLLKQAGLAEGVDLKRGMAVVLPNFNLMGEPKPIILLPITGEGAFLANFEGVKEVEGGDGLIEGRAKKGNLGRAVMRIQGGYAQLAEGADQLGRFEAGAGEAGALWERLGRVGQSQFAMNQATAYLNLEKVGPMVAPLVQMGLMQAKAQMRNNPEQLQELGGPEAAGALIDMYGRAIKAVLTQSHALVLGLNGGAEGAAIRYGVQFKPGSEPAKVFTPSAAPELGLNRLPAGEAMMAGVMDMRAMNFGPLAEGFAAVVKQMPEDSPMTKLMGVYQEGLKMTELTDQASFAWYAPALKEGEQPQADSVLDLAVVYTTDEPDKLAKVTAGYNESMVEAMAELAKAQGMDDQTYEKLRKSMKVEREVERINGKPVDRVTLDMETMMMQPGGGELPKAMDGEMSVYWTTTDEALVGATGETMDRLQQTLGVAGGSGELGKRSAYRSLRRHLPADRCAEFFVDVTALVKWAMAMEGEVGAAAPEMGPMAMSLTSRAGGAGATVYLPSGMLKEAVEGLGPLLQLMMMGGMGPGGGAPPAGF